MDSENVSQGQLPGPDFNKEVRVAQATGDFDFVLDTARKSRDMLVNFRDAIKDASFSGKMAAAVGMGLNFLENMIANSNDQIQMLKQTEKATRDALRKAAEDAKKSQQGQPGTADKCSHGVLLAEHCDKCKKEPMNKPDAPEAPSA